MTESNPSGAANFVNLHAHRIETITANNSNQANQWLVNNASGNYCWTIDGADVGNVNLQSAEDTDNAVAFRQFGHITGGIGEDVFQFTGTGSVSDVFDGGSGDAQDRADFSGINGNVDIVLGSRSRSGIALPLIPEKSALS